jgi:TonB-dependent SusC/RagA subfamily outer membrane receptor
MDNQDTLFNQIKSAAQNAESKEFPAMDKVWNRVEDKLDHKVLTKQNTLWKKIAVAASILLVVSIGYQFFKDDKEIVIPKNTTVSSTIDSNSVSFDTVVTKNGVATSENENSNPNIKKEANQILEKQINNPTTVASTSMETISSPEEAKIMEETAPLQAPTSDKSYNNSASTNNSWLAESKFRARGVAYKEMESDKKKDNANPVQKASKKEEPLIVIDDKKMDKNDLKDINNDDLESFIVLPDPLYIINGVYYTEKEVFGPNPTSPYTPLNQQEIESISILQDEKAISIYGEKGKKGVVIITTKNGKPTPKKKE